MRTDIKVCLTILLFVIIMSAAVVGMETYLPEIIVRAIVGV